MDNSRFRADVFAQLSEFFKEPTGEFSEEVASGGLLRYFENAFSVLKIDASVLSGLSVNNDVYATLRKEYGRLFLGPMPPYIMPVESVYKKWTNDPACKLGIAGEKGHLMGDPALDMIKRYRSSEIVIPEQYASMPDHIALELEYMSFLSLNASREEQKEFLNNHLDWTDNLSVDIKNYKSGFYSTALAITRSFICA